MKNSGNVTTRHKFQNLRVYQMALENHDLIYALTLKLPVEENYNLGSQLKRAATSVVLNIAEGSTSQSDTEQSRFIGFSIRSYLETIACLDLLERRGFILPEDLNQPREHGHMLFIKLQAFRKSLIGGRN